MTEEQRQPKELKTAIFENDIANEWLEGIGTQEEKGDIWYYEGTFIYGMITNKSFFIEGIKLIKNHYLHMKPFRYAYAIFEVAYVKDGVYLTEKQYMKRVADHPKLDENSRFYAEKGYSLAFYSRHEITEDEFRDAMKYLIKREKIKVFDKSVLKAIEKREDDEIEESDKILGKYIQTFGNIDDHKKPLSLAERSIYAMDSYKNSEVVSFETFSTKLNNITGGGHTGETWIIGGYTGDLKTQLSKELVYDPMKFGDNILFVTLEMLEEEMEMIYHTRVAYDMGMPHLTFNKIRRRQLNDDELEDYKKVVERMQKYDNLTIYQPEGKFTMDDLEMLIDRIEAYRKLDIVVVDYLELIDPDKNYESIRVRVKEISRMAKRLATRKNVWMIIPHQISRNGRERAEKRSEPYYELRDLQESSGVEQNCVCMVWVYRDQSFKDVNKAMLGCAKYRMGETSKYGWEINTDLANCRLYEGGIDMSNPLNIKRRREV